MKQLGERQHSTQYLERRRETPALDQKHGMCGSSVAPCRTCAAQSLLADS